METPKEVTLKVIVHVKVKSYEYDSTETIIDEFSQETHYDFDSTDNVEVVETELVDCQLL